MKTVLVDSSHELRDRLKELLALFQCFEIQQELDTTEQALDYVYAHETDVIFINTQPADPKYTSNGAYLSVILNHQRPDVQVVVYSKGKEEAYEAYRNQCAGYLCLPFDPLALQALVGRLRYIYDLQQAKKASVNRSIMIRTKHGYQLTNLQDILFLERRNRRNCIVTTDGQEIALLGYTMNELEKMLDGYGFYRCYQSFIVNLSKISVIRTDNDAKTYAIQFDGYDGEILLSRTKYAEFVELLKARYAKLSI